MERDSGLWTPDRPQLAAPRSAPRVETVQELLRQRAELERKAKKLRRKRERLARKRQRAAGG